MTYMPFRTADDVVNNFLAELRESIPGAYLRAMAAPDPAIRAGKLAEVDNALRFFQSFEWLLLQADGEDLIERAEALLREAQ